MKVGNDWALSGWKLNGAVSLAGAWTGMLYSRAADIICFSTPASCPGLSLCCLWKKTMKDENAQANSQCNCCSSLHDSKLEQLLSDELAVSSKGKS